MNQLMEYTLLRRNIRLEPRADIYSPGGLRKSYTPGVREFIDHLEERGTKLRYSGGLVPDVNQVLMKRSGVFFYPHLLGAPQGKLRLLFELNPMALLMEQAGGAASNGRRRILELQPEAIDDCQPFFCGCREDVLRAEELIGNREQWPLTG